MARGQGGLASGAAGGEEGTHATRVQTVRQKASLGHQHQMACKREGNIRPILITRQMVSIIRAFVFGHARLILGVLPAPQTAIETEQFRLVDMDTIQQQEQSTGFQQVKNGMVGGLHVGISQMMKRLDADDEGECALFQREGVQCPEVVFDGAIVTDIGRQPFLGQAHHGGG